jgi:hypothetical protein
MLRLVTVYALALLGAVAALPAAAAPRVVEARNLSVATRCAEEDNVDVALFGAGIERFAITALPPAYAGGLTRNDSAPDFTDCAAAGAHDYSFVPRTETLFEDDRVLVRGVTYPRYWRPERVPVVVGARHDAGFHLVQLFVKEAGVPQEVLVLHAADGYWRARPLPLPQFDGAVYGSSFLVGPIERDGRPLVRIARIEVDPEALSVRTIFAAGGEARVTITTVDAAALRLAVTLALPAGAERPFAELRSMFVRPDDADVAELHWRTGADGGWQTAPILGFERLQATALRFGRSVVSRHNSSAPDLLFEHFEGPAPAR